MRQYDGPHIHAALDCLAAGYPENAVSWMWRDIGELDDDPAGMPAAETLVRASDRYGPMILYETVGAMQQGVYGDGI